MKTFADFDTKTKEIIDQSGTPKCQTPIIVMSIFFIWLVIWATFTGTMVGSATCKIDTIGFIKNYMIYCEIPTTIMSFHLVKKK
jgi:hypothetical protein